MNVKLIAAIAGGSCWPPRAATSPQPRCPRTREPTQTVTIEVGGTGPTGPAGPAGPQGEPGPAGDPSSCPAGSTWSAVEFVQPGEGPTTLLACVKN